MKRNAICASDAIMPITVGIHIRWIEKKLCMTTFSMA